MPTPRTLNLKKETLTVLTTDELRRVVGADESGPTMPIKVCLTPNLSFDCPSWQTEPCWDPA